MSIGTGSTEVGRQILHRFLGSTVLLAEVRRACMEAGMDDFVAKPVAAEDLYARLLKWLSAGARSTR